MRVFDPLSLRPAEPRILHNTGRTKANDLPEIMKSREYIDIILFHSLGFFYNPSVWA